MQRLRKFRINQEQASAAVGIEESGHFQLLRRDLSGAGCCAGLVFVFRYRFLYPAFRIDHAVHIVQFIFVDQLSPICSGIHEFGILAKDIILAAGGVNRHIGHDDVFDAIPHGILNRRLELLRRKRNRVFRVFQVMVQHACGGIIKQEDCITVVFVHHCGQIRCVLIPLEHLINPEARQFIYKVGPVRAIPVEPRVLPVDGIQCANAADDICFHAAVTDRQVGGHNNIVNKLVMRVYDSQIKEVIRDVCNQILGMLKAQNHA